MQKQPSGKAEPQQQTVTAVTNLELPAVIQILCSIC
jgi:hypothetical protein